jgi:hypothetical protein
MSETPEPMRSKPVEPVEPVEPEYLEAEPVPPPSRAGGSAAPERARSAGDMRKAWMVALAADFLQWVLFPVFMGGALGVNAGVDLLVAFLLVRWMGWHLAFLPAFVTELIPIANFVPSWTLAMWIVTRMRGSKT